MNLTAESEHVTDRKIRQISKKIQKGTCGGGSHKVAAGEAMKNQSES